MNFGLGTSCVRGIFSNTDRSQMAELMLRDILLADSPALSRRDIVLGAAGLGASVLLPQSLQGSASESLALQKPVDFTSPETNLLAYVRLIGDVSGKPSYGWGHGRVFGTRENELSRLLFDYQSCRLVEFRKLDDGSWAMGYRGLILFTDPKTGHVIDNFRNPFTGEDNEVVHFRTSFGASIFGVDGPRSLAEFERESPREEGPFVMPWKVVGDDVWATYDERIAYRRPDGEWRVDNAVYRYHGFLSQLTDPDVSAPYNDMMWSTELNWFTYMNMRDMPGHITWAGMGRKYDSLDPLPGDFLAEAERRYPGVLTTRIRWDEFDL